ncbi:MAG: GDP-mannose 4,6-dehydratase [Lentisphaerota bacterium]
MAKRWFIIGSNSFSGASFIRHLLEQGVTAAGCSRSPEALDIFLPYKWIPQAPEFVFHQLDMNLDTGHIIDAIRQHQAEYVVNFAAQSMVAESWLYPDQWYQTNVVANVRLHEELRKIKALKKYVHVTTPEVYGNCSGDVRENTPFNPSTPYAASRAACDLHLLTFFKQYKFPVVFTRAANVYGPGQQLYRIIPKTIFCIKSGIKLPLHGGGTSVRSFIHMNDVSRATRLIAEAGKSGECYHISTSHLVSIRELVEMTCSAMEVGFDDVVELAGERPGKDSAYRLDSSKIRNDLGWQDNITLQNGIAEVVVWMEKYWDQLKVLKPEYIHKP